MSVLKDNDNSWSKFSHTVKLEESFTSFKEAIEFALAEDTKNDTTGKVTEMLNAIPEYYNEQNTSDSSVGGNDAINPYWQFGEDDDIVHPLTSVKGMSSKGMGRVYSENYDRNQQILWLSMGVPKFTDLSTFYSDSADLEISKLMNTGDLSTNMSLSLGKFLGTAGKLAFQLPFLPAIIINKVANYIIDGPPITKYYDFKPSMTLYYRMANVILSHLAVGMGLYGNGDTESKYNDVGIPTILEDGPDIFAIMNKRAKRNGSKVTTTDDLIDALSEKTGENSFWDRFTGGITGAATGATDYIGFKVERSTDTSESISNSTGASSLVGTLNGAGEGVRDKKFALADGTGVKIIDGTVAAAKDVASGVLSAIGAGGAVAVMTGNGYYDIPDVWKESTFSKSYNFNVQLRSRYGDPVSIYQSIYVPLAMWLAAALPRGIGTNMYTSPFLIRGYCKGMFSVPLGIIESLTIKRGLPEFGWSVDNLPTAVDISVNIKDLSPAMFLSISDASLIESVKDSFARNDNLQEYLSTLSGLGVFERANQITVIKQKMAAFGLMNKNTLTSPLYWGRTFGSGTLPRAIGRIGPWNSVPRT